MDDVTILNEIAIEVVTKDGFNWLAAIFGGLAVVAVGVIAGLIADIHNGDKPLGLVIGLCVCLAASPMIGALTGRMFPKTTERKTIYRYEVIIDDNVSYKEFTDKYTVIEQRGQIYVVEEKDSNP